MTLVTGGTGFIGSHLIDLLVARGTQVRAFVRRSGTFGKMPVQEALGDLASGDGIPRALTEVDTVIHLAGATKVVSRAEYRTGNVRATENLARAIAGTGRPIRMVHVSSLAAAGPSLDGTPIPEDAPPHPVSEYGKSKLQGEQMVRAILPDAVIVRPPAVYGPRDTDVFEVISSIRRGFAPQVGNEVKWFSAIYAGDLAKGIMVAAENPRAIGRTYFLAYSEVFSQSDFNGIASQIMGVSSRILRIPVSLARAVSFCAEPWSRLTGKPGILSWDKIAELRCQYWVCDARRAKEELGFEAPTNLNDGLARTLAWYREAGWLRY